MVTRHVRPQWQEAYDAQMALWRWYRTPGSRAWLAGMYSSAREGLDQRSADRLAHLMDAESGRLIDCDPIYVSADMCEIVDHARHGFEPEPLRETDLITPRGFLYFAKPLTLKEKHGHDIEIRAISWSQQFVTTASVGDDEINEFLDRAESVEAFRKYGDRYASVELDEMADHGLVERFGVVVALYGDRDPYIETCALRNSLDGRNSERARRLMQSQAGHVPLVPIHLAPWNYGMTFGGNEVDVLGEPTGARQWWQLGQATFRLMQQRIARKGFEKPGRPQRREAARLGYPPDTEVVVVRLRHESSDGHEPTGADANYSHRFIVGGHWRNQWYPSEAIHRQIYIYPYVKGPEDKPLIVRPRRVFQWTR